MSCLQIPVLTFCLFIMSLGLHAQDTDIMEISKQAKESYEKGEYYEAREKYTQILNQDPDNQNAQRMLAQTDSEILFQEIERADENESADLEEKCKSYIDEFGEESGYFNLYGETGKHYDEVRNKLYDVFVLRSDEYVLDNNKTRLEKIDLLDNLNSDILDYLGYGAKRFSDETVDRMIAYAKDGFRKAKDQKKKEEALAYCSKLMKLYGRRNAYEERDQLEEECNKISSRLNRKVYMGMGYIYNSEMPYGFFLTRLSTDLYGFGYYISFSWNSVFFRNFNPNEPAEAAELNPPSPRNQILFISDSEKGWGRLGAGASYQFFNNLYGLGGISLVHGSTWQEVRVYEREQDLGSGELVDIEYQGDAFDSDGWQVRPEIGLEYRFWKHGSVRYVFTFTNKESKDIRHAFGLSIGF